MPQKGNITVDNRNDLLTSTVIMGSSYLGFCGPGNSWLQNYLGLGTYLYVSLSWMWNPACREVNAGA